MCRSVWNQYLREQPLDSSRAKEALLEAVTQIDAAIEDLTLLWESTTNHPVKLGAVRARIEAFTKRQDLMRMAGVLPSTPRAVLTEVRLEKMGEDIYELLEKFVPESLQDQAETELIAALDAA